ncbi:MAG: hypothetical protein ABIJ40_16380 [Bacteroidota bacterium]|nr:hypothetical protein [Candidatus Margulisiibacteriota bacterium]
MKKFYALVFITGIIFILVSCSSTVPLSNIIPFDVQQNIKTIGGATVDFKFIPNPAADNIQAKVDVTTITYSLNSPLEGKFRELVETKFGKISSDATDKITFQVVNVDHQTQKNSAFVVGTNHILRLSINVILFKDGIEEKQTFSYQTSLEAVKISANVYSFPPKSLDDFMLKFVVAADKFIDATYKVEN